MRISLDYGTHLSLLIPIVNKTTGAILELGMGVFSTPYLHFQALFSNRQLVSYDNNKSWTDFFASYECPNHKIILVDNWEDADIEKAWDVVLVDHSPGERRKEEVKRLVNFAKYIIIHDSNAKFENEYHYSEIYPLFKYKVTWSKNGRYHTTILSNLDDFSWIH
jgi:hypothetical protein